ncbi:Transcription elongation factor spt6 [Microbotryomycetes sp. JL201]|nr:Transcription elongation factor spt6 [Microbotryomycetes sp. JL201]
MSSVAAAAASRSASRDNDSDGDVTMRDDMAGARPKGARARDRDGDDDNDNDDADEDEDEDERGIDLMGDNTGDEDSSDEDEDDSEEERRVRKDFIVDEDEIQEKRRRRKEKRRERKRRERQLGDDGDEGSRKRRKDSDDGKSEHGGDLDEDDLALLEENTGVRLTHKKPKLKRLRRRKSVGSDSDRSDRSGQGLNRIFSEDEDNDVINEFADEMAGFIEDDTQSESGAGSDEDDEERAARRARRQKERKRGRRAGLAGAPIEGISQEDWQEVTDVFGNGQDYAFALESDDEPDKDNKELKDIFEPSQIASRMLTEADDIVRRVDIPERMQLQSATIKMPETDEQGNLLPFIPVTELPAAAEWVSTRLGSAVAEQFLVQNDQDEYPPLHKPFMDCLEAVLKFINVDFLEIPFIVQHRADYLVHHEQVAEGQEPVPDKPLLTREDLWHVEAQSIKYRAFADKRRELRQLFLSLNVDHDEYFDECFEGLESVEEVADLSEWVSTRYATKLAELREQREQDERAALEVEGMPVRKKRATRESAYDIAKKSSIAKFAQLAAPDAAVVGRGFTTGLTVGSHDLPEQDPDELAEIYSGDGTTYSTPQSALAGKSRARPCPKSASRADIPFLAAKLVLVHELSRDPFLKRAARRYFVDYAVANVLPTDRGRTKIDEMHPFYAFKYLNEKPLTQLLRTSQFLQIMTAEKDGLVECRLRLPERAYERYCDQLKEIYITDADSSVADAWNAFRQTVLDAAIDEHIIPAAEQWAKTWLQEEEERFVGELCSSKLYQRINVAPYCRRDGSMEKGDVPSVLALSHGAGDPQRDDTTLVYLDSEGYLREHVKIGDLFNVSNADRETLTELLKRRRPQVVVIGGFSPNTKRLRDSFDKIAQEVSHEIAQNETDQDEDESLSPDDLHRRAQFDTVYVYDDVARIFSNSAHGSTEFPELPKIAKYCVGLARFAQSPLHEYAALGQDLTAVTYDPAQKFASVSPTVLRSHLERALIEVVNKVGVDINRALRNQYYASLLPYVSGLGLRKADHLIKRIQLAIGGTLSTRESLVLRNILGKNIFINVASFLRIPQDELQADLGREDAENNEVLDDTRIHPAEYEIARKMASDAMDLDEEDIDVSNNKSQAVIDLMENDTDKLFELSLDDFAVELQRMLNEPKRLALYMIRDELRHPYRENREDYAVPRPQEVFAMLTGESASTLAQGLIVPARVVRLMNDGSVMCRLDSGMMGIVPADYRSMVPPRVGQTIQAQLIEIDYDKLEVQLASREELVSMGDKELRQVRPDQYYDIMAANAERTAQSVMDKKAAGARKRVINHPAFQNVDSGGAEQYLAHMQRGDCVIRPSSKEDHLAVTWKIADGVYQHLAVAELNKADEFSLGSKLKIGNAVYSDLDELLAVHIRSLSAKAGEMMAHEKFKGTQKELESWLGQLVLADPGKGFYGFCFDPDIRKAGQFLIGARADEHQQVPVYFPVQLRPGGFVFNEKQCANMVELTNAFKLYYYQRAGANPAPRRTGKTPLHPGLGGGRTPGGRTPHGHVPGGGRTPDPRMLYGGGGQTPLYSRGNATPMYNGGPGGGPPQGGYPRAPPPQQQYYGR